MKSSHYPVGVETTYQQDASALEGYVMTGRAHAASQDDQVLNVKHRDVSFITVLMRRLISMMSVQPIIGNIIAIGLAIVALHYIYHEVDLAGFHKYCHYFGIGIQVFAGLQVIKSGARSLLLPLLAMIGGGMIAHTLGAHETLFTFNKTFYEYVMITGVIGLGFSILSID